jgi:biotin carboxylase
MYGRNPLAARCSPAANSRLVDRRYHVPPVFEDWRAGHIRPTNTEREEAYIQAVLRICEREQIDAIFPSWDPKVYVFSKNKERFERMGVLVPVPDYETVVTPLDKYRTMLAAQAAGFPCPRTFLPESEAELDGIASEIGFPLVIKARFTSGGDGLHLVRDRRELRDRWRAARKRHGAPVVQEYIPGRDKRNSYLVFDKRGQLKVAFCVRTHRLFLRIYRNSSAATESSAAHPFVEHAARLAQSLGWWGSVTVQAKLDPRDGQPKLMEMNPRLGHHLWLRTAIGINEPLMALRIARGEEIDEVTTYSVGTMLLNPVEDFMTLGYSLVDLLWYRLRTKCLGRTPADPYNPPMSLRELARSYARTYLGDHPKVFDPYFRHFPEDPAPSILWWLVYLRQVVRATRHLGA